MRLRFGLSAFCVACVLATSAAAQDSAKTISSDEKPLPDLTSLLARAKSRSDILQELQKNYVFKKVEVADQFDSKGNNKGSHTDEYQVFFVEKTEVQQHVAHDSKPLSNADQKKEQERIDRETAEIKAHKQKAGMVIHISSLLKLATVSDPRREVINGRPAILFNYKGNPDAKADGPIEEVMKKLSGTLALDEQEAAIVHMDGALDENFHVMGGLLVNVKKGSHFEMDATRVNDEIWFVHDVTWHVDGRILLFKGFDGDGHTTFSDYRKMRTSVTILPGSQAIGDDGKPIPNPEAQPETASPTPPKL